MLNNTDWFSSVHNSERLVLSKNAPVCLLRALLILVAGILVPAALADTTITPDIWNEFSFVRVGMQARGCSPDDPVGLICTPGPNSIFIGAPSWMYTAPPEGAVLKVTDAFTSGDAFNVFDFGGLIFSTPIVAPNFLCGSSPDLCFADPAISHSSFNLAPGAHSITITPIEVQQLGAAYLRVDPVPEPSSLLLQCLGSLVLMVKMMTGAGADESRSERGPG